MCLCTTAEIAASWDIWNLAVLLTLMLFSFPKILVEFVSHRRVWCPEGSHRMKVMSVFQNAFFVLLLHILCSRKYPIHIYSIPPI